MLHFSYEFGVEHRAHKGGGGGGSSGKVDFPQYIKDAHGDWVDHGGVDAINSSMVDVMNSALGNSPFSGLVVYDPDTDISAWLAELTTFNDYVDLLSSGTGLDALVSGILDDSRISDEVDAFAASVDAQLTGEIYPRFEAGMRDINAVISSAFVIGRAIIEDGRDREVARFEGSLRMKAFGDDALRLVALKLQYQQTLTEATMKAHGLKIAAKKEEVDDQAEFDEQDARWDLEVFQYGANLLAAPGGGVMIPKGQQGMSKTQATISGAMAGASVGASTGSGYGVVIGAVVGGVAGYMSA